MTLPSIYVEIRPADIEFSIRCKFREITTLPSTARPVKPRTLQQLTIFEGNHVEFSSTNLGGRGR